MMGGPPMIFFLRKWATQKKKIMGSAHFLAVRFLGAHDPYIPIQMSCFFLGFSMHSALFFENLENFFSNAKCKKFGFNKETALCFFLCPGFIGVLGNFVWFHQQF